MCVCYTLLFCEPVKEDDLDNLMDTIFSEGFDGGGSDSVICEVSYMYHCQILHHQTFHQISCLIIVNIFITEYVRIIIESVGMTRTLHTYITLLKYATWRNATSGNLVDQTYQQLLSLCTCGSSTLVLIVLSIFSGLF